MLSTLHCLPLLPLKDFFLAKPIGVVSIMDEQSSFPKASDDTLVTKLNSQFKKLGFYHPAKGTRTDYFTVDHYAGPVRRILSPGGGGMGGMNGMNLHMLYCALH